MRLQWVVAFAILAELTFARVYTVVPIEPIHLNTQVGAKHSVAIPAHLFTQRVECYLSSPSGLDIPINDDFDYAGFESFSGSQVDCGLNIVVSKDLTGNWTLFARSIIFTTPTERRLPFSINIKDETQSEEDEYEPEPDMASSEEDNIVWFSQINRLTRTGQSIDITLSKIENDEHCYFITPDGDNSTKISGINGVTVHESSDYVSCRITVGPMEDSLLGIWTLCGKATANEEQERCQRVNISWNNNDNPISTWPTDDQRLFNHSVSLGGYLRPVVIGSGTAQTCHVITPNGEDLVLTADMDYPKIQRRAASTDTCAVSIGPIEPSMLGSWTLYGQFRSTLWFNEVRQPMNMFLYDEDNPLSQPYNITNLDPVNRVINLDTSITEEVTGTGNIDSCYYRAPSGQLFKFHESEHFPGVTIVDVGNFVVCRISIGPLNKSMLGEWHIIGKFSKNGIFTERRQTFNIIQEDPENPLIEDRTIENLTEHVFDTKIGANQTITILRNVFISPQSCHIRTPGGRQYTLMDGFNVPGVTILSGSDIECGVAIEVFSEDMVGEWVLIARSTRSSRAIERRLSFIIYVEEQVETFQRELIIAEGSDLYVRLRNPTEQYDTCKLVGPKDDSSRHEVDAIHNESCGFVVKSIGMSGEGTWEIVYGSRIIYRATVNVSVIAREVSSLDVLTLIKDRRVNKEIGPENAVYCKLIDPNGLTVFDDFGRCKMIIERVTMDLNGYWMILVGFPGRVLAVKHEFLVTVTEAEPKAIVSTRVKMERPSLVLSCSVSIIDNVRACKFRDPSGNILIANQGVGEDRFIVHGSDVSIKSELRSHECGLRITNPTTDDLGLWRCGIESDVGTHYGFLSVVCPWLMVNDPEVSASVVTRPSLKSDRHVVSAMEGEGVTMSCSIQSAIRYCYFRSWNGTVFSINPATSSASMEYVGSGFDAGECGVRFQDRMARDSGEWSCHVGLFNETEEHRARFNVFVTEPMVVRHYMHRRYGLVVEARVNRERQLDYCRFVRADGIGFTTDFIPREYEFLGSLDKGHCLLRLEGRRNDFLNRSPWTIAVKIRGQDSELSMQTTNNLVRGEPPTSGSGKVYIWVIFILIGLSCLFMAVTLGPKKNRKWTYERASQLRNSLRHSFRKPRQLQNA